jgi:hypothetical protein
MYKHTETMFLHSPRPGGENSTMVEKRKLSPFSKGRKNNRTKRKTTNAQGKKGKGTKMTDNR